MHAFVLARREIREADQLITLLTRESGKMTVLARGVKKIASKLSPHVEPSAVIDVRVVVGKSIDRLIGAEQVQRFPSLARSLPKRLASEYLAAFLDLMLTGTERDDRLFDVFLSFLRETDATATYASWNLDRAIMRIFFCVGMMPLLDRCVVCDRSGTSLPTAAFSPSRGGVVCSLCVVQRNEDDVPCVDEDSASLRLLSSFCECVLPTDFGSKYPVIHTCIYQFARHRLERNLVDWRWIETCS